MGFSAVDYVVLAAYLVGITLFGSRFRKSHRTVKDYFVGRRQTSWVVISLSIVATETSTLTLIGVPALAYTVYPRPELGGSFTYLQVVAGYIVARFVISALLIPAYFHGEMLTAYELLTDGIPFRSIADGAAAALMAAGKVQFVVAGADRIATNGDTANKIGTYALAVLAAHHGIPFVIAAPTSTIDPSLPDGSLIPIEERGAEELTEIEGVRVAPEGTPSSWCGSGLS